ncbi:importin beta-like SAD2 homolog, partial [Salvia splendens]|uniref:importin beta-like SAD2 homolog n=1 Tax=Salvia splendens TaxID=180675 RepID=UPI001C259E7D
CANPDQRRAAELSLNQNQFEPQHLVRLLQIVVEASYDLAIRQLASITLKNIIAEDWAGVPSRILPEDKHVVRQNIPDLIAQVLPILRAQLGECLKTIIHAELSPEQLPNLLHWVNVSLQEQQVYRALFVLRILVRKYQFDQADLQNILVIQIHIYGDPKAVI